MASSGKRPCAKPGCGVLATRVDRYCRAHIHLKNRWAGITKDYTRENYGSKWKKLRKYILERDMGICQECNRRGIFKSATHVDHVRPKSQGGTDDERNLEALCAACHNRKTGREGGLAG